MAREKYTFHPANLRNSKFAPGILSDSFDEGDKRINITVNPAGESYSINEIYRLPSGEPIYRSSEFLSEQPTIQTSPEELRRRREDEEMVGGSGWTISYRETDNTARWVWVPEEENSIHMLLHYPEGTTSVNLSSESVVLDYTKDGNFTEGRFQLDYIPRMGMRRGRVGDLRKVFRIRPSEQATFVWDEIEAWYPYSGLVPQWKKKPLASGTLRVGETAYLSDGKIFCMRESPDSEFIQVEFNAPLNGALITLGFRKQYDGQELRETICDKHADFRKIPEMVNITYKRQSS